MLGGKAGGSHTNLYFRIQEQFYNLFPNTTMPSFLETSGPVWHFPFMPSAHCLPGRKAFLSLPMPSCLRRREDVPGTVPRTRLGFQGLLQEANWGPTRRRRTIQATPAGLFREMGDHATLKVTQSLGRGRARAPLPSQRGLLSRKNPHCFFPHTSWRLGQADNSGPLTTQGLPRLA